jgi:hypothetical protein
MSLAGNEMKPSEIKQIAKVAEKACATAVNHPRDADVRADLLNALGAVVDPAFTKGDATHSSHLHDLLCQTSVWASLVRCRVANSRNSRTIRSVGLIQYPTRDLKQLLSQLIDELELPAQRTLPGFDAATCKLRQ